ncbi:alpha/beta hydrolase [Cnuibacter physcomitrellae]|uniref:alpha/beta fold hydrolase n=1 Tax=Cnuibacter physcomitrellae TaxID=1619308 RepID=UPI002175FA68|nr:alpha/beta hydrolase [Cnuibacter physcomitrellae]MCS5496147.1 alpha/beta hydrolase [Cnuibacter physcomitrellae]
MASPPVTMWGPESGGSVVLLPGFGSTVGTDFALLGPMLGRSRRAIGLDPDAVPVPGAVPEGSLPAPAHLVGYGAGAAAALRLATGGAVRPASVTLIAPVLSPGTAEAALLSAPFRLLRPEAAEPAIDRDRAARELAAIDGAELVARAADTAAPMLVIRCTDDALAGPDDALRLVEAAPDARLASVDSGHGVFVERPAEVLALLARFLDDPHAHPAGSSYRAAAA